ncbi:MAG: hypothetical protein BWY63_03713 [Chloroflexi bacterium ADurb.Bin360]|nr:MAG: hypothetical protein BWY63_03713 [Chloroflexi bacterium ADurb.Bin360]
MPNGPGAGSSTERIQYRQQCQCQRQQAHVRAAFYIILDAPLEGADRAAKCIHCGLNPFTGENVLKRPVSGVAKKVRNQKSQHAPFGISPAQDFLQGNCALAETGAHTFVEWQIL